MLRTLQRKGSLQPRKCRVPVYPLERMILATVVRQFQHWAKTEMQLHWFQEMFLGIVLKNYMTPDFLEKRV